MKSNNSDTKADGVKHAEIELTPRSEGSWSLEGGNPGSLRKKGFWRLARAGGVMAIVPYHLHDLAQALLWKIHKVNFNKEDILPDKYVEKDMIYLVRKTKWFSPQQF